MDKSTSRPAPNAGRKVAHKRPYKRPTLQEFGKLHRLTGGQSVTGNSDGASGMAMQ